MPMNGSACHTELPANNGSQRYDQDELRARFCLALSKMYRTEVPLYGTLVDIVSEVDTQVLATDYNNGSSPAGVLPERHALERHGAIRLGTAEELGVVTRLFAVLGMHAVGYYDLTATGLPLHASAFRPIREDTLERNPFRMFTSLLRMDLLPTNVRALAEKILMARRLFSPSFLHLLELAESGEEWTSKDQARFIAESLTIFRWHSRTAVSELDYFELKGLHPIVADIVCFPSAHVNHLTPRTLDIDLVQQRMCELGLPAKEQIEGPPRRECNVLLRQTSFKALEEHIKFQNPDGMTVDGFHTARFGEVEQRGAALTRVGRSLYDEILGKITQTTREIGVDQVQALRKEFGRHFPDNWSELRRRRLVFCRYHRCLPLGYVTSSSATSKTSRLSLDDLVTGGFIGFEVITYEDFLPLSAAGIFRSNLADFRTEKTNSERQKDQGSIDLLEDALGCRILDEFELYAAIEEASIERCREALGVAEIVH